MHLSTLTEPAATVPTATATAISTISGVADALQPKGYASTSTSAVPSTGLANRTDADGSKAAFAIYGIIALSSIAGLFAV
jgi:hypothetical protein